MKRGIAQMLGLLFATLLSANSPQTHSFGCRGNLVQFENHSLTTQIELDLLSGVWIQGDPAGPDVVAQFSTPGQAVILHAEQPGERYRARRYTWQISQVDQHPVLVLRNAKDPREEIFFIAQTCRGIDLTNVVDGRQQSFTYLPAAGQQQEKHLHALTGAWENMAPELTLTDTGQAGGQTRLRLKTAILSFEFRPDGTFTRVLANKNGSVRFEEEGRWEVSRDGNTLFLHWPDPDGGQYTQYVRIKMLEMDELVLEKPLSIVGQDYVAAEDSDFFFNKQ